MKVITGAYVGTGSLLTVETPGFRPGVLELYNAQGLALGRWNQDMPDDSAFVLKREGSGNVVDWVTSGGVTPTAEGFTVGTNADLNTAAETVYWTCYEAARLGG